MGLPIHSSGGWCGVVGCEEWRDNIADKFSGTATFEKLEEVCQIDFDVEVDLSPVTEAIDAAESVDLPSGFGRD